MKTGETGIRVVLVVTTETDEIQVGEMERKENAIDMTGTKTVSVNLHRGKANGTLGRILNPEKRESRYNYKVCSPSG